MTSFQSDGKAIMQVFIGAIVTVVLMAAIGTQIVGQTNTITVPNTTTVTAPAVNATLDLNGRELLSQTSVFEASNGSNTSIGLILQTGTGTNGLRTVQLTLNDTAAAFAGAEVNVSYTANPDGYLSNSGARAMDTLILIFGALAIMVFVIVVFIKFGSLGKLIGRS